MTRIDELAMKCGVSRSTVMNVAQRIHEIEGWNEYRYPTEEGINNRQRYYKKSGRPTKFKMKEE